MAEILRLYAEERPQAVALADELGETTWAALSSRVNRLVHALRGAGLEPGATVAILAGNRREYFELFSACAHASFVAVPINWHFTAEEVAHVLADSRAAALFAGHRFVDLARSARSLMDAAGPTGEVDLGLCVAMAAETLEGFQLYEELLAAAPDSEPPDQGLGGVMFYTSGTTGRPKGVRRLADIGSPIEVQRGRYQAFGALLGLPREGVTLVCGPVYHSAQWAFSMFPLELGSTLVSRHRFDAAETLDLIDRYRVTNVHLVPTQFIRLLDVDQQRRDAFDGSSLELVLHGAAPCPPEVKRRMIEWWGPVITEYYGGTEGAVVSTIGSHEWLERPTSVGKPLPMVQVVVMGEDGQPCPPGVAGRIFVRNVMAADFEYHGNPEETSRVHLEPGLFTMGDVGFVDDSGFLHLTDREIDMIISGGVNIYPAEVERVLGDHPAVADVAVFGVPDAEYGEQVKAAVVPRKEVEPSPSLAEELITYCRQRLAAYKAPKSIDFERELPRQATGKLFKRRLRERYWQGRERQI